MSIGRRVCFGRVLHLDDPHLVCELAGEQVKDWDGELGEIAAVGAMLAEDFTLGLFIAVLGRVILRGDAGAEIHVEIAGCSAVRASWFELASGKANIEFEAGEPPFF